MKPLPFSRLRVSEGRGVLAHYAEQEQTRETLAVFQREGTEGRECQYISLSAKADAFTQMGAMERWGLVVLYSLTAPYRTPFPMCGGVKEKEYATLKRLLL